jgi:hypothetical protein
MCIFFQIAVYDSPDHTVMGLDVSSNRRRFQKQQNPLCCVFVRVVLTADLMNNVMAKSHVPERPGLTRRAKKVGVITDDPANFLCNSHMVGIRLTVYQVRPIQITA